MNNVEKFLDELINGTWLDANGMNHNDDSLTELAGRASNGSVYLANKLVAIHRKAVALRKELQK